jgi:hypothetical protein
VFSRVEMYFLAIEHKRLFNAADEMHFDSAFIIIEKCEMIEILNRYINSKPSVDSLN